MAAADHLLMDTILQTQAKRLEAQMLQQLQDCKTISYMQSRLLTAGQVVSTLETRNDVQMLQIEQNLARALQLYDQARAMRQQQNQLANVIATLSKDFQRLHAATTPKGATKGKGKSRADKEADMIAGAVAGVEQGKRALGEFPPLSELLSTSVASSFNASSKADKAAAAATAAGRSSSSSSPSSDSTTATTSAAAAATASAAPPPSADPAKAKEPSPPRQRGHPSAGGAGAGSGAAGGTGAGAASGGGPTETALEALAMLSSVASANAGRHSPAATDLAADLNRLVARPPPGGASPLVTTNPAQAATTLTAQSLNAHDAASMGWRGKSAADGAADSATAAGGRKRTCEEGDSGARPSTCARNA